MNPSQTKSRILLADDHEVVRSGIRNALRDMLDIEIVGEVGNGIALKQMLAIHRPDGLLIDVAMPDFDPIADIRTIRATYPDMRILVVSAHDDDVYVQGLLGAGVNGYHMKDQPLSDLRLAVQRVLAGQRWVTGRLLDKLVTASNTLKPSHQLTRRQKDILSQLKQGFDNQTIARNCGLSIKTVENHLTRIYRQLGVQSRLEAVSFLMRNPHLLENYDSPYEPTHNKRTSSAISGQPVILLVDDNHRYRKMLRQTLERLVPNGHISEAGNILDAVQMARSYSPQLALVDVVLGNESGIDCTQALAKLPNSPRIVLITAYPDQEFRHSGREAGAAALVDKKDLNVDVLRQIVADI
ncbi:MAG: DNA-binding NarL/FixJ family response regulator [Cellvibrionaceae bacterium]|jgi:DNA-binding NarL/FixJ family response regulator